MDLRSLQEEGAPEGYAPAKVAAAVVPIGGRVLDGKVQVEVLANYAHASGSQDVLLLDGERTGGSPAGKGGAVTSLPIGNRYSSMTRPEASLTAR